MPNHQASEQMLGYLYQVRYALALLLENDNSDCQISIEKFDDVAFSKDDIPIQLIQLKHHIQHQGNLADASTDMWRTIKVWLDLNKVTVIVDKPERPVPLKQLGSGSNWVGVHLIAYFALQHYFIGAKRPVPRFMFLDQPSQVYFPSEFDEKKTDWNEVNKIYQFVIDRTTELQGQLQVIIVDHADLKKDSFREFIRENWWPDDKNLVPIDWYKSE